MNNELNDDVSKLKAEIERNKLQLELSHESHAQTLNRLERIKARCDELEGLLSEALRKTNINQHHGFALKVNATLSKPAGSDHL